jgi:hypothetical protein
LYLLAWQYLREGVTIRALVSTNNTSSYLRAAHHVVGALLMGWRDLAKGIKLLAALRRHGVPVFSGCGDLSIEGKNQVEALVFRHRGRQVRMPASLLLLHQGVVPNTQLSWLIGGAHQWNPDQLCWRPITDARGPLGETRYYIAEDGRAIVGLRHPQYRVGWRLWQSASASA